MKTITAVDLRHNLEDIVKRLIKGEHMELSYRGETVARLLPTTKVGKSAAEAALERLAGSHANDPDYARKAEQYVQEVYEDRRSYGGREVPE